MKRVLASPIALLFGLCSCIYLTATEKTKIQWDNIRLRYSLLYSHSFAQMYILTRVLVWLLLRLSPTIFDTSILIRVFCCWNAMVPSHLTTKTEISFHLYEFRFLFVVQHFFCPNIFRWFFSIPIPHAYQMCKLQSHDNFPSAKLNESWSCLPMLFHA